jgi:hypothetical protein
MAFKTEFTLDTLAFHGELDVALEASRRLTARVVGRCGPDLRPGPRSSR